MLGWFPGHMNKARRQIKDALPEIDVVIEVLDARPGDLGFIVVKDIQVGVAEQFHRHRSDLAELDGSATVGDQFEIP